MRNQFVKVIVSAVTLASQNAMAPTQEVPITSQVTTFFAMLDKTSIFLETFQFAFKKHGGNIDITICNYRDQDESALIYDDFEAILRLGRESVEDRCSMTIHSSYLLSGSNGYGAVMSAVAEWFLKSKIESYIAETRFIKSSRSNWIVFLYQLPHTPDASIVLQVTKRDGQYRVKSVPSL